MPLAKVGERESRLLSLADFEVIYKMLSVKSLLEASG